MTLDKFLSDSPEDPFKSREEQERRTRKYTRRGWYIRRETGELEGTFLSQERAEQYIKDRPTDPRYKNARVEFVAE